MKGLEEGSEGKIARIINEGPLVRPLLAVVGGTASSVLRARCRESVTFLRHPDGIMRVLQGPKGVKGILVSLSGDEYDATELMRVIPELARAARERGVKLIFIGGNLINKMVELGCSAGVRCAEEALAYFPEIVAAKATEKKPEPAAIGAGASLGLA